jgi:hypothetical protein
VAFVSKTQSKKYQLDLKIIVIKPDEASIDEVKFILNMLLAQENRFDQKYIEKPDA